MSLKKYWNVIDHGESLCYFDLSGQPSGTRPDAEHGVEGDPLVKIAVLDGDGDDDAGHEHHGRLLHVFAADRVRGHYACNNQISSQ